MPEYADCDVNGNAKAHGQAPIVAVMQPYLFPYIGYYQLLRYSDIFVLYDDANFKKRGYINRNTLFCSGRPQRFTLPVLGGSQNRSIRDLSFVPEAGKLIKTIRHNYANAPFLNDVLPLVESVVCQKERGVTELCQASITRVMDYLELPFDIRRSSDIAYDRAADVAGKLISICQKLGSKRYINAVGGQQMYDKRQFAEHGISLSFIRMGDVTYAQGSQTFVANLSIIDALMWCTKDRSRDLLNRYEII